MYFSTKQILKSIEALKNVHPFFGITFLTCKKNKLTVNQPKVFAMDSKTKEFLKLYHRLDTGSDYFFQPYKSTSEKKKWVRNDYPSSGLQAINTQTFNPAFIHSPHTRIWAWSPNYVSFLAKKLNQNKIPAYDLAIWLFKDKKWSHDTTPKSILSFFIQDFNLTEEEITLLFNISLPTKGPEFVNIQTTWNNLQEFLSQPPDAKPDQGGMLSYLETRGIGPAINFVFEPADRLTIITGDNGLGKSFLLECAWWALTGEWAGMPAYPNPERGQKDPTEIIFEIKGEHTKPEKKHFAFNWKTLSWPQNNKPTIPGLIVYARVDGSFAIWDPASQGINTNRNEKNVFSSEQVWDGFEKKIEGLIRDWIRWQNNPEKHPFETFKRVLAKLSPPDLGILEPGEPVRIPSDSRDIPTIKHPYGITPILYTSAGVRRIITLSYLIVWAWNEHVVLTELAQTVPQRRMVVLIDEMEAHLHPRWQREVLPAILSIGEMLSNQLDVQFIVATHSPLVMASAEPIFKDESDVLLHLDLQNSGEVSLKEIDFKIVGDVSSWLTSPVFELDQARSKEAEGAIKDATNLQIKKEITKEEVRDVSSRLIKYLASDDKFWPRWIVFAEKHGVDL